MQRKGSSCVQTAVTVMAATAPTPAVPSPVTSPGAQSWRKATPLCPEHWPQPALIIHLSLEG